MRYSVDDIVRKVRVFLDMDRESGDLISLDDASALSIEEIIRSKLIEGVRLTLLAAPAETIDTARPLRGTVAWRNDTGIGMGVLSLPDNFLRLLSVKMTDWKRPARIITEQDEEYAWQSSRHLGVRGNPDRPVAAVVRYPEGVVVELYSCIGGADVRLERGLYVAQPVVDDDGMVDIPRLLLEDIVRQIAALVQETLGNTSLSPSKGGEVE